MTGFSFNNIHSNTYNIVAKSVNRPMLPVMRKKQMNIPGRHGAVDFYDGRFEKRIIQVKIKFKGSSSSDLRNSARDIAEWLYTYSSSKTLSFDDESDKYYNARVLSSVDLNNLYILGEATVQFECKPFAYADYDKYDGDYEYDDGNNYDTDLIYDNDYSSTYTFAWEFTAQTTSQYNHATYSAGMTITISGSVTNPTIKNVTTGLELAISATLTTGVIIIDTDELTVTISGTNSIQYMSGDWVGFATGQNNFIFSGTSPSANVYLSWNHNWL